MSLAEWLSLAAVCALGAISPGPSLAVVLRNTLASGRGSGLATGLAHALGVGIYALAVAFGLGFVTSEFPTLFRFVQLGGAAFLAYLGVVALVGSGTAAQASGGAGGNKGTRARAARDGFLIAFLNPKIAIWFLALFSQFLGPETGWAVRVAMAALAATIDGLWYSLVAVALSQGSVLARLRRHARTIDRVFGLILIALALRVLAL